jgi:hypothetical protein
LKKVLELVNPSLYPLIYGKSLTIESINQREIPMFKWIGTGKPIETKIQKSEFMSEKFQWIPSDIEVTKEGKVKFLSYINNLHPYEHSDLYGNLSSILEKFIPMFENVLTDLSKSPPQYMTVNMYDIYYAQGSEEWYDQYWAKKRLKGKNFNEVFKEIKLEKFISLKGRKLQVIVKLENIILTPENPTYRGSEVWNVEGMENESIFSSGIYYYDVDNIQTSKLDFRHSVSVPQYLHIDFYDAVQYIYNLGNGDPLVQEIGYITPMDGRCIAFPNTYQNFIHPFSLKDKTKMGHQKILIFYLINPKKTILSTSDVPPQQKEWMMKEMIKFKVFDFPKEIISLICDFLEFPIGLEESKKDCEELIKERKLIQSNVDKSHFSRRFSHVEY